MTWMLLIDAIFAILMISSLPAAPKAVEYFNSGTAAYQNGSYNEAIYYFNQSIKLDPNDALAYSWRGSAYSNLGEMNEALADFNQSIKLDPSNAMTYEWRGVTY